MFKPASEYFEHPTRKFLEFTDENKRETVEVQKERWITLGDALHGWGRGSGLGNIITPVLSKFQNERKNIFSKFDSVEDLLFVSDDLKINEIIPARAFEFAAAYIYEWASFFDMDEQLHHAVTNDELRPFFLTHAQARVAERDLAATATNLEKSLQPAIEEAAKSAADAREAAKEARDAIATYDKKFEDIRQLGDEMRALLQNTKEEWGEFLKTAREAIKLDETMKFWGRKVTHHQKIACYWATAFIVVIACVGALAVNYQAEIANVAPKFIVPETEGAKGGFSFNLGGSVLVTGTAVIAFWLGRICVKFLSFNLSLAEDARHRNAILENYIALTAKAEDDKTTTETRVVMLNALFRPLPGHQETDLAPPSITDVIQQVTGKNST